MIFNGTAASNDQARRVGTRPAIHFKRSVRRLGLPCRVCLHMTAQTIASIRPMETVMRQCLVEKRRDLQPKITMTGRRRYLDRFRMQ